MKKRYALAIPERDGSILLGRKADGYGVGLWNGFSGKIEEGETDEAAACRELAEESGLVADNVELLGTVLCRMVSKGLDVELIVFRVTEFSGEPKDTSEMNSLTWFAKNQVPINEMWEGDRIWLAFFLAGKKFGGEIFYDEHDRLVNHTVAPI